MEILALLWFISLFLNPIIAQSKNRSGIVWFFIALFTGPLFTLILLVLPKVGKKCPQCAETVNPKAKICRFCKHEFQIENLHQAQKCNDKECKFCNEKISDEV